MSFSLSSSTSCYFKAESLIHLPKHRWMVLFPAAYSIWGIGTETTIPCWRGSQRPCQGPKGASDGTRCLGLGNWIRSTACTQQASCLGRDAECWPRAQLGTTSVQKSKAEKSTCFGRMTKCFLGHPSHGHASVSGRAAGPRAPIWGSAAWNLGTHGAPKYTGARCWAWSCRLMQQPPLQFLSLVGLLQRRWCYFRVLPYIYFSFLSVRWVKKCHMPVFIFLGLHPHAHPIHTQSFQLTKEC